MKNYTVGQEVGYARYNGYNSLGNHGFATVAKINGHGHIILSNGMVFDKFGNERGERYAGCNLVDPQGLRNQIADLATEMERRHKLAALHTIIRENSNAHGTFFATPELKAQMIALVNEL